jgi:hypothetical protein
MTERVLHVCLRVPGDPQAALARALRGISSEYAEVSWCEVPRPLLRQTLLETAHRVRATLVFAQIQTAGVIDPSDLPALRQVCDPSCVIVQWDGDRRFPPTHPERSWFAPLGMACDASLVTCTSDASEWARMGVPRAGFLQIGVDADLWRPCEPAPNTPPIVALAGNYSLPGYERRTAIFRHLTQTYPGQFAVYGHGWGQGDIASRPFLQHAEEAPVLSAARAALSMSIRNDLPHYTSDRLFRCLAAGALTLVEEFPGMRDLGLRHGVNCLIFRDWEGLRLLTDAILAPAGYPDAAGIRAAARELALTHTWDARMVELLALVDTIRRERA